LTAVTVKPFLFLKRFLFAS